MPTTVIHHLKPHPAQMRASYDLAALAVLTLQVYERGRNLSEVFDMGSLIHETAAMEGKTSFNIFVVGGQGAMAAQFNPAAWRYDPAPASDAADYNLTFLSDQALPDGFTVIDLRPLRPILTHSRAARSDHRWSQIIHGFDALVVMPGSHASLNL